MNESQDLQNFISASKITIRFLDWADQQISTVSNQVKIICEINTMKIEIFSFSHYGISERLGAVNAMGWLKLVLNLLLGALYSANLVNTVEWGQTVSIVPDLRTSLKKYRPKLAEIAQKFVMVNQILV